MSIVQSEYFIKYYTCGADLRFGKFNIVMELVQGVDYRDVVVARKNMGAVPFKDTHILNWAKQLGMLICTKPCVVDISAGLDPFTQAKLFYRLSHGGITLVSAGGPCRQWESIW